MFPAEFVNGLRESLGPGRASRVIEALAGEPGVSVRVNPFKMSLRELREHFGDLAGEAVPWAADEGFYLLERPSFTLDPLFHAGAYYVQEASSMYAGALFEEAVCGLGRRTGLHVLDLCAAPGGKTTQLLSHLDTSSVLVANEVVPSRATVLSGNVARWGCPNVAVTSSDPSSFSSLRGFFDVAVVDAPCSGEGMFRKDGRAVEEWSPSGVKLCASRQRRILGDMWPALAPGGYLIYSTCTFNHYEDEDNVEWICSSLGAACLGMKHFYPGEDRGEGFFAALLRKDGTWAGSGPRPGGREVRWDDSSRTQSRSESRRGECRAGSTDGLQVVEAHSVSGLLKQVTVPLAAALPLLGKSVKVIASGTAAATRKGRDLVPEADFALACVRCPVKGLSYETAEVSREDALKFLSREAIVLPGAPRGYLLLTFKGQGLGFVNNLGSRTNSLLPGSRRIRKTITT